MNLNKNINSALNPRVYIILEGIVSTQIKNTITM